MSVEVSLIDIICPCPPQPALGILGCEAVHLMAVQLNLYLCQIHTTPKYITCRSPWADLKLFRYIIPRCPPLSIAMPFFEKAQYFSIHGGEMNDVRGNYTRNETRTAANNNGSYNQYNASTVAMGNREVQTAAMGVYFVSTCNALLIICRDQS